MLLPVLQRFQSLYLIKLIFLSFNFWCLLPLVLVPSSVQQTDVKSLMRPCLFHSNTHFFRPSFTSITKYEENQTVLLSFLIYFTIPMIWKWQCGRNIKLFLDKQCFSTVIHFIIFCNLCDFCKTLLMFSWDNQAKIDMKVIILLLLRPHLKKIVRVLFPFWKHDVIFILFLCETWGS